MPMNIQDDVRGVDFWCAIFCPYRHPPVLHKWFAQSADPSVWLSKRLAFSRSQALWKDIYVIIIVLVQNKPS